MIRFYFQKIKKKIVQLEQQRTLLNRFPTARFEPGVQVKSPHLLSLGQNVQIQKDSILHCGGMEWSNGRGKISIGDDAVISPNCIFYGAGEIEIGDRFDCGPGCYIFSSRTDMQNTADHVFSKVTIGNDVVLFAGCILSPGITLGDGVMVGAGSLILNDLIEPGLYAGTPAKLIRPKSTD